MKPVVANFCKSAGFRFTLPLVASALIATRLVVVFLMATTSPWRQAGQEKTPSLFWRLFSPTGSNCWAHTLHWNWRQFLRYWIRIGCVTCFHVTSNTSKTSNTSMQVSLNMQINSGEKVVFEIAPVFLGSGAVRFAATSLVAAIPDQRVINDHCCQSQDHN